MTQSQETPITPAPQTFFPSMRYLDAREAIAWLERVFGARTIAAHDGPGGEPAHVEMSLAGNTFMFGQDRPDGYAVRSPKVAGTLTGGVYVVLPDAAAVDALHARARDAGATIVLEPYDTDYGSHDFSATDLDGHIWRFGTYRPS